jgi:hypothetical protein
MFVSAPLAIPVIARSRAAAEVLLLMACLVVGLLVLLAEHHSPHGVRYLLRLGALLEDA